HRTSRPAPGPTGQGEPTSPVRFTDSAGNLPTVKFTERAESTSPVKFTEGASEPRESKRDQRKRRTRPTSPVKRKTVADRARELDELIRSGELAENSSVNRVRIALRCSPENARRAIEWRREHLTGEVTGEAVERLTGEP